MAVQPQHRLLSVDEYLALERERDEKYEYIDGQIYLMDRGTTGHSAIAVNVLATLVFQLRGGPCGVFNSDAKVRLAEERYVYPDVSVSCDERDRQWEDAVHSPVVSVEVLAPSTESYDRGRKFGLYRACATIQEYVLVNTDQQLVEVYRRGARDAWTLYPFGPCSDVELPSIGVRFPLADAYAKVSVPVNAEHGGNTAGPPS